MFIVTNLLEFNEMYRAELWNIYRQYISNLGPIWPYLTYQEFVLFIYDYSKPNRVLHDNKPYLKADRLHIDVSSQLLIDFFGEFYEGVVWPQIQAMRTHMNQLFDDLPVMNVPVGHNAWERLLLHSPYMRQYIIEGVADRVKNCVPKYLTDEDKNDIRQIYPGIVFNRQLELDEKNDEESV